jgi:hypothetical protein
MCNKTVMQCSATAATPCTPPAQATVAAAVCRHPRLCCAADRREWFNDQLALTQKANADQGLYIGLRL